MSEEDEKEIKCPHCAEEIQQEATKCSNVKKRGKLLQCLWDLCSERGKKRGGDFE